MSNPHSTIQLLLEILRFIPKKGQSLLSKYCFLNATTTTFTFEYPKFNLKHYLAEQHLGFGNDNLTETLLSTDQEITDEGETYLVHTTGMESEMLNCGLRSLGRRLVENIYFLIPFIKK